jgi:hypothetical protein
MNDVLEYKYTEQSILQATREYEAKLKELQPDIKLDISISGVASVPTRGSTYCLLDDSAFKVTVYDKTYLPF